MHAATRYGEVLEVAEREGVDGAVRLADGRALLPELQLLERNLLGVAGQAPFDAAHAARHLLGAGGKRLRPMLVFLSARLFGREPGGLAELAVVAELTHSATLLHDDVIDLGEERRHRPAARMIWGNAVSVLAGDFLLTRALMLARESSVPEALPSLLSAMDRMVCAEIHQLALRGRLTATERDYWEVVDGKTASLFEWCASIGSLAGGASRSQSKAAARFASGLGAAFQVVDDLIDFVGTPEVAGKSVWRDLAEGKLTLPVLRALQKRPELKEHMAASTSDHDADVNTDGLASLGRALQETGVAREVQAEARNRLGQAIDALHELPESPLRNTLESLARASVERSC